MPPGAVVGCSSAIALVAAARADARGGLIEIKFGDRVWVDGAVWTVTPRQVLRVLKELA